MNKFLFYYNRKYGYCFMLIDILKTEPIILKIRKNWKIIVIIQIITKNLFIINNL